LSPEKERKPWADRLAGADPADGSLLADAEDWRTCSVGEKLGFPRPKIISDHWLKNLIIETAPNLTDAGGRFLEAVKDGEYGRAAEIHEEIRAGYDKEAKGIRDAISEECREYYECVAGLKGGSYWAQE